MKSKFMADAIAVLLLAASIGALAQSPAPRTAAARTRFSGIFDTYTPQSTSNNVTTGPYEIHGPWSMVLTGDSHANFLRCFEHGAIRWMGLDPEQRELRSSRAGRSYSPHHPAQRNGHVIVGRGN
jgi:hypothetical protein